MASNNEISTYNKCYLCNHYLSYFPIYSYLHANVCGRCLTVPDRTIIRNIIYENFAQFRKFPCRYEKLGCTKQLLPCDVQTHEQLCRDRFTLCPKKCLWKGSFNTIVEHYVECHPYYYVNSHVFEIDVMKELVNNLVDIVIIENKIFAVKIDCKMLNQFFLEILFYFEGKENQKASFSFEIFMQDGICTEHFLFDFTLPDSNQRFVLLPDMRVNSILRGFFRFGKSQIDYNQEIENWTLLNTVNCFVCGSFQMDAVAYGNKVFCTVCFTQKFTKEITQDMKTEIISIIKYPCKNKDCYFSETLKLIETHEKTCSYSYVNCHCTTSPLCTWNGQRTDLITHILNSHDVFPNFVTIDVENTFQGIRIMTFDEYLFWVVVSISSCEIFCTVQVINNIAEKLIYQVDLFYHKKNKFIIQKPCCIWIDEDGFNTENRINNCHFLKEQLCFLLKPDEDDVNKLCIKLEVFRDLSV